MTTYLMILDLHKGQVEHVERFDNRTDARRMAVSFLSGEVAMVPHNVMKSLQDNDITTFGAFTIAITESIN